MNTLASTGGLRIVLRSEGLCELALAVAIYAHLGASWTIFALAFLTPDIAFLGYFVNPRIGAIAYNTTHSLLVATLFALLTLLFAPSLAPYSLIWFAHIGFDRSLGYGLKSVTGFQHTHLGAIGSARASAR